MYSFIINLNDHYCSMFLLQLSVVLVVPMEERVLAQMFAGVRIMIILVHHVTYVSFFFFFLLQVLYDLCSYHQYVNLVGFFFLTAVCNPSCLNGGTCIAPPRNCSCVQSKYTGPQCELRKLVKKRNSTREELAQEKHSRKPIFWNSLIFIMIMAIKFTPKEKNAKQNQEPSR